MLFIVSAAAVVLVLGALLIGHRQGFTDGYETGRLVGYMEGARETERIINDARKSG